MNEIRLTGRHYLAVTLPSAVADGVAFELTVTAKNGHHDALGSAYPSAQVTLVATIDGEDVELSPEVIDITNGTWTGSITPTFPAGANLDEAFNLSARTVETVDVIADTYPKHEYQAEGWDEAGCAIPMLVLTVSSSTMIRGTASEVSVQAQDGLGNVLVSQTGTVTLTISGGDSSDVLAGGTVTLTSGEGSANITISGGSGTDSTALTAEKSGFQSDAEQLSVTDGLPTTLNVDGDGLLPTSDADLDFSYFNTARSVTGTAGGLTWSMITIAASRSISVSRVTGRYEVKFSCRHYYSAYGLDVVFRATSGELDPRLCDFVFDRYAQTGGCSLTYGGEGTVEVIDP